MLLIVLGTKRYGRIDDVPNTVHVATMFFHVMFVPLIPLQSQIVIDGGQYADKGMALAKIRWASVLMTWLRFWLVMGVLGALAGAFFCQTGADVVDFVYEPLGKMAGSVLFAGVAAALIAAIVASYRLTRANAQRADELRRAVGMA